MERTIPYRPHEGQILFHEAYTRLQKRFRVLACGTRWGKDRASIMDLILRTTQIASSRKPSASLIPRVHAWAVAPDYPMSEQFWRELKYFTATIPELEAKPDNAKRSLTFRSLDVVIEMRSADRPESLVGVGLDMLCLIEAALIPEEAWHMALRPRLSSPGRAGLCIMAGTPKGMGWYHQAFQWGQDEAYPDWWSLSQPTEANPYIDPEEIKRAEREMPERWFKQEYKAEWLSGEGSVFQKVREHIRPSREPIGAVTIVVDWGKRVDFTWFIAVDSTGHVVGWERMKEVDYTFQVEKLKGFVSQFPSVKDIFVEQNAQGDPLLEQLARQLPHVHGFTVTGTSKRQLIEGLALALEQGGITYPDIPLLLNELEAFEYTMTTSGNVKYSAPSGSHDDGVIALALACQGVRTPGVKGAEVVEEAECRTYFLPRRRAEEEEDEEYEKARRRRFILLR